ncbi:PDZ domain-containing protein [Niallia endozanthoxylica]|uniref:PDZ domain-containing protein n=1 Tax=Niallia endozanthoxylica TaxID=2036016 RepID=A0A5J5HDH5_9BACI|nr:PDZ domain-containing protein [Niallia endozanthoxylica]KAA9018028.1 PDZ domain-containing protein [Niallia endozanthoxylica]
MALDWGFEFLNGLQKLFLNPLFYYLFIVAGLLGFSRVKRERKQFHVRAKDPFFEIRQLLPLGFVLGLILSVVTIAAGLVIPIETVIFAALFTFLWSLTTNFRFLSPVYTIGFAFFATLFFLSKKWSLPLIESHTPEWNQSILPPIAALLGLLIIAEGILIFRNGRKGTSPKLVKGRRGLRVGVHEVKRLWMLPLFLIIPGEALQVPFEWWPVFSVGGQTYSILLVPFAIGYYQQIQGKLPVLAVMQAGKKIVKFGIVLTCLSVVGYWYPLASIVLVALAIIGRELLSMRQRLVEDNLPFYFSQRNHGVMILGVIPDSPAEKMGLDVGEVVFKVNGVTITDEESFYEAMQKNRAHCKLEVFDVNEQVRFVQRALYEGDHHQLGILFVQNEKKWEDEVAVAKEQSDLGYTNHFPE